VSIDIKLLKASFSLITQHVSCLIEILLISVLLHLVCLCHASLLSATIAILWRPLLNDFLKRLRTYH